LVENINTLKGAGTPFKIYYDKNTNAVERPSFNGILARRLLIAPKETENFVMYGVLCSKETIEVPALLLELLNSDMTKSNLDFTLFFFALLQKGKRELFTLHTLNNSDHFLLSKHITHQFYSPKHHHHLTRIWTIQQIICHTTNNNNLF